MLSFLAFALQSFNQHVSTPGGVGDESVELCNRYLARCHGLAPIWLHAVDWQHVTIPGWGWNRNTPRNFPEPRSIVVWGECPAHKLGPSGHVAIVITSGLRSLFTYDQNWPPGAACGYVEHDYEGVLGWHTPPSH